MQVRETLELILTSHALERLRDTSRFPVRPEFSVGQEVRLYHFRRSDSRELVWMCQIAGGFLVGVRRLTKRRQILIALTAINREMFDRSRLVRLGCYRVTVDKITEQ